MTWITCFCAIVNFRDMTGLQVSIPHEVDSMQLLSRVEWAFCNKRSHGTESATGWRASSLLFPHCDIKTEPSQA